MLPFTMDNRDQKEVHLMNKWRYMAGLSSALNPWAQTLDFSAGFPVVTALAESHTQYFTA